MRKQLGVPVQNFGSRTPSTSSAFQKMWSHWCGPKQHPVPSTRWVPNSDMGWVLGLRSHESEGGQVFLAHFGDGSKKKMVHDQKVR